MCGVHGTAIDSPDSQFTVHQLLEWKKQAETESRRRVLQEEVSSGRAVSTNAELEASLREAAESDLKVFRETAKWPSTSIALTLKVDGFEEAVTTDALARAARSLDDLILVAPPGMGKTTTLFQIAEGLLKSGNGTPLVVPLADWATENTMILESVLKRPAFRGILEDDLRKVATQPGVVLLFDGWNELDELARKRARVQISKLKEQLPKIGLVISTRKQALDIPFAGMRIDLLPLSEDQQMQIATAMRDDAGAKIVDQAWRTAGVRELVTIPLYLTTLLSLPINASFPTTKEEVLRRFVNALENDATHSEALQSVMQGCHQNYLEGLANCTMRATNTVIADSNARRCVSEIENLLADSGQIMNKPEPTTILNVLVSNHILMRVGDLPGYSFQHQQFQEWYASHLVERRIIAEVDNPSRRELLKAEVFNLPVWEEAILFAVERLARGSATQKIACGKAITAAFEVAPILAAEMIYRCTEDVWAQIASTIQGLVARWHTHGKVDRGLRFMLTSGRPDFLDEVWPLITEENDQISRDALRNCGRFRPSILGKDAESKIRALAKRPRVVLLSEMASQSDMDGLDLACAVAKNDPDPEVQATVVSALSFRRADRHVAEVLQKASDKTFDLIVSESLGDEVNDEQIKMRIAAARVRLATGESSIFDRLRLIANAEGGEDRGSELTNIICAMEFDRFQDAGVQFVHMARKRYPGAVANGLLARVRTGHKLFYGTDDVLASAGFALEDEALLELALVDPRNPYDRAEAAASVLGPKAAGHLVDTLLEVGSRLQVDGQYDREATDMFTGLQNRIAHVPGTSLVAAVVACSAHAGNEQMAQLADLLSRAPNSEGAQGRPFDAAALKVIQGLVDEWGNRMLASGNAKRRQTAKLALLASCVACKSLLPILKGLLDDNLRRYHEVRALTEAADSSRIETLNESRMPHTLEYQRAFMAIRSAQTTAMMKDYLTDEYFGEYAAQVLANQWRVTNEPPSDKAFFDSVDFSRVVEIRAERAADPDATSAEAEMIFEAVETLVADGATDEQKRLAVTLGLVASRLPHGQRDSTIQQLIVLAPRQKRSGLLLNLVLSGSEVDINVIVDGINEIFEEAKTEQRLLTQIEDYELQVWLQILPFSDRPIEALSIVRSMPPAQRTPQFLEKMVKALTYAAPSVAEEILFNLAEEDPRFYSNYQWRTTAFGNCSPSSARRIVDLTAAGVFAKDTTDDWYLIRQLGNLFVTYPDLRPHVYHSLKCGLTTRGLILLSRAVAESPDEAGLLLLVAFDNELHLGLVNRRTVERVVTRQVYVEDWSNANHIVPVYADSLRQKLLALTIDGGPKDAAAYCLLLIDQCRDEYGAPETEPRHPDLESGKPWPILLPIPEIQNPSV